MIRRKNWVVLTAYFLLTIVISFFMLKASVISVEEIKELGPGFQYNLISTSAIIGGFLFTGLSILISVIDKDGIKRLWENNYLDNLYRSALIGMIMTVITIISAVIFLCCTLCEKLEIVMIYIEVITLIVGIVSFIWCIKQLSFIISQLKKTK